MLRESEICKIVCPETQCKKRCSDYARFVRVCEAQHKADLKEIAAKEYTAYSDGYMMGKVEFQKQKQEMIAEIENNFEDVQGTVWQLSIAKFRWQELKHKWGIE